MNATSVGWRQDVPVAGKKIIEADPQIVIDQTAKDRFSADPLGVEGVHVPRPL